MKLPKIDSRTKEDLLQYIKTYLSSYAPEWRFDENNPDVGTALAYIYADMMSETVYRFNQVSDKNRAMFFGKIGARLLPAVPANGYVTFSLVNEEVAATCVRQGEEVLADGQSESLIFETVSDVLVTPAKPDCLYLCNRERDQISRLAGSSEELQQSGEMLFDLQSANLQEHTLYFSHPSILHIKNEAWVYCTFADREERLINRELLLKFLEGDNVSFEYYSEKGFIPFEKQELRADWIALKKGQTQPAFALGEYEGVTSYWVRVKVKNVVPFADLTVKTMLLRSGGQQIPLDAVNVLGTDQKVREFFPFGERASVYNEVYLVSEEVFGKRGAAITMDFDLDFLTLPIEIQEYENEIDWKAVMKRNEVKVDIEYDVSIAEVIWEYYNGEGFTRLFANDQYADIFGIQSGTGSRRVSMRFTCPMDIQPMLVNSTNACCIRARVLKMNNLYKLKGNYISPLITNPRLSYEYVTNNLVPEYFSALNNLDTVCFEQYRMKVNEKDFRPLEGRQEEVTALYMGFEQLPLGGPIKMLFSLEENKQNKMPALQYEYSAGRGFRNLNAVDETENFRKTGVITMIGNSDFCKKRLFGKERYWIRILDVNNEYYQKLGTLRPQRLMGIHMNTTPIIAIETKEPEFFAIAPNEENKKCRLEKGGVYKIRVWVNEFKSIHRDELPELEKEYHIRYEHAVNGEPTAIWVEWQEAEQFEEEEPNRRCYVVNRIDGTVEFPNGRNGKIPTWDEEPTIRIEYSCGGGSRGNLPEHQINRLNRSIGFISTVDNYEMTIAGCEQEQVQEAIERNSAALRHGYRAVTTEDYENLARAAARNICKAKCFSNRDDKGNRECGHVTLVVLQKDYEAGRKYFDSVSNQIMGYMKNRVSAQLIEQNRFHITEPDFLELSVSVSVRVSEYDQVFEVRTGIRERLDEFLNPLTGNYHKKGWEIGTIPNTAQISNALKDIRGIYYIENVRMVATRRGQYGMGEVDIHKVKNSPYILPLSGNHEIIVKIS